MASADRTSCSSSSGSPSSGSSGLRVVTNRPFVQRRARIGRAATLLGFGALLGGLIYSGFGFGGVQESRTIFISYTALILGYVLISVGKNNWLRFSLHPRPDEALAMHLKSLDVKTVLFNYVHALPVEHLLYTPTGLLVVDTRPFVSEVFVKGDRWSRRGLSAFFQFFSEGALGNPSRDALAGVQRTRKFIAEQLGEEAASVVSIEPLIAMTHPRAKVNLEDPTVPVVYARDARPEVKRLTSGGRLPGDLGRRLETLLLEMAKPYGEPVSAGEAIDKRVRRRKPARAR